MKIICLVCGSEKRYYKDHRMFKRCDSFNTKHALNYYYNINKIGEKKKNYYQKNKEVFGQQNKKRRSKLSDLISRISTLTEMITSTLSVS